MNKLHLFAATLQNDRNGRSREVIVKFSRRYGINVHRFLAEKKQAPKVLHFTELSGNWFVVVMEKVEGKPLGRDVSESVQQKLKEVMKNLQTEGYVHGDLRPPNVLLLDDGSIRVVDFDWAGKSGQVNYPLDINQKFDWHEDVGPGKPIVHDHDIYQVEMLNC